MEPVDSLINDAIILYNLEDWRKSYQWLTGYIGDPASEVWFIGENPSLSAVDAIHKKSTDRSPNLQWNSSDGDRLFREALVDAGLKTGNPNDEGGWRCYVTNAIKEPEIVVKRNERKQDPQYWKIQADRWIPTLQAQIDLGSPKVLVALGRQSLDILSYMCKCGLKCPRIEKIDHYSYIMLRPEAGSRRGPRHPDRIAEFKKSVEVIAAVFRN